MRDSSVKRGNDWLIPISFNSFRPHFELPFEIHVTAHGMLEEENVSF